MTKYRTIKPGLHITTDGRLGITDLAPMGNRTGTWKVYTVDPTNGGLTELLYITDSLADAKAWIA